VPDYEFKASADFKTLAERIRPAWNAGPFEISIHREAPAGRLDQYANEVSLIEADREREKEA